MPQTKIKTGIVGFGFSAKTFHIPFITNSNEFEFCAISTRQTDELKQHWPNVTSYSTAQALMTESDVELIIITAPNDVHFELAKLALEHDKHVVLEKPFVTKVADGETLIELAEQKNRVLSVYHNRRWDGDFLTVKALIEENKLGNLKCFNSHFDRFRPEVRQRWREQASDGGGILYDLGPHLIDQVLELFGLPDAITAHCKIMRKNSNNIDFFDLLLHYPTHLVNLHADLFSAGTNRRFTLMGDKGSFEKVGLDPQEARLIKGIQPSSADWAAEEPSQFGIFYDATSSLTIPTLTGGYQHYYQQLASAICDQGIVPVSARSALQNIQLIELAMISSETGKTIPVQLSNG